MEKRLILAKVQRCIERVYFKTLAWLIPIFVMMKTCETLIPFETEHPVQSRAIAIAVLLLMYVVGKCLEKGFAKHLEKRS